MYMQGKGQAFIMYKIETIPGAITQYKIQGEEGNYFKIAPERGGIVTEFCAQGKSVLWMDWDTFYDTSRYVWGGIPVLFPNCGALKDDTVVFGGTSYQLPLHGFARNLPWQVVDTVATEGSASITLQLQSSEITLAQYPFAFTLGCTYQLEGSKLNIYISCQNRSSEPMPVQLGFHTYFEVNGKGEALHYETPCTRYLDLADNLEKDFASLPPLTNDQTGKFLLDARGSIAFTDSERGLKTSIQCQKEFPLLLLWAGDGEKFCIEPWTGPLGAQNTKEGLVYITTGETWQTGFSIIGQAV